MATVEPSGKRFVVRRSDGTYLTNDKGNAKHFRLKGMADMYAENVTNQENNPHKESWREVVRMARVQSRMEEK